MHADRHTSRRVYTMFWTLTDVYLFLSFNLKSGNAMVTISENLHQKV